MNWGNRADDVNEWWKDLPGERFWLDVTKRDERDRMLAAPRGEGRCASKSSHRLITCVRGGDVVFHYDAERQAIVAVSIAQGRVEKRDLDWPIPNHGEDAIERRSLPSWAIALRRSARLDAAVPLFEIARVQWNLFPSLRALEEQAGDPLYYPFEMGNPTATRPLSGYVFKLPALFVNGFPQLASAAGRMTRPLPEHEPSNSSLTVASLRPHAA